MKWPVITAIVNTYKRPDKLPRALESVLKQGYDDFEVIVIHDGPSCDATKKVCDEFAERFEVRGVAFQHVATTENSGYQCVPKNVATWMAQGDYIAYLDDDNEWTADHLSVLLEAIEEGHSWPDFTYGKREYKLEEGYKNSKLWVGESPFVPFDEKARERIGQSPSHNFIDTSDVLVAKGAIWRMFLATGRMWNEDIRRFGDWEFFARGIHFSGWRGKGVDKVVQHYYWHGENIQLTRPVNEVPEGKPV